MRPKTWYKTTDRRRAIVRRLITPKHRSPCACEVTVDIVVHSSQEDGVVTVLAAPEEVRAVPLPPEQWQRILIVATRQAFAVSEVRVLPSGMAVAIAKLTPIYASEARALEAAEKEVSRGTP